VPGMNWYSLIYSRYQPFFERYDYTECVKYIHFLIEFQYIQLNENKIMSNKSEPNQE